MLQRRVQENSIERVFMGAEIRLWKLYSGRESLTEKRGLKRVREWVRKLCGRIVEAKGTVKKTQQPKGGLGKGRTRELGWSRAITERSVTDEVGARTGPDCADIGKCLASTPGGAGSFWRVLRTETGSSDFFKGIYLVAVLRYTGIGQR